MKKTERLYCRLTSEEKEELKTLAHTQDLTISAYLQHLIDGIIQHPTHEQQIQSALTDNQLINTLLMSPEVPLKAKQFIGKEMKKYV